MKLKIERCVRVSWDENLQNSLIHRLSEKDSNVGEEWYANPESCSNS